MIKYRVATIDDVNSLKELWLGVFSDTPQAVDMFFQRIFPNNFSFVAVDDNTIVAMLHFLNASVNGNKTVYLYGAATRQEYRKQGIMKNLLEYALGKVDVSFCVTLPADNYLYDFYAKLGFINIHCNVATASREDLMLLAKPYEVTEIFVNGYCGVRNRVLKSNFLFWNNNHINYAFDYNQLYGAKVINNNYGYVIFYEDNDICNVIEIICDDRNAPYMFTDILSSTNCKTFNFHLSPSQQFLSSKPQVFGMVKYLTDNKLDDIYLGLTLE